MNLRTRQAETNYLEARYHLSHVHAVERTRLSCHECGKEVDYVMEFECGFTALRLCVDCLYEAYSTLRHAAYENARSSPASGV
jgi:hypothetical protein